ncbi:MAG: hypothetical protein KAR54_02900 [Candidatus Pacebacteria bacterium]|nr:hypothetical protein [Candidatus Paceibacterota bacterium]
MTPQKIKEVIEIYQTRFEKLGIEKTDYPHEKIIDSNNGILYHCYGMTDKMLKFLEQGRVEKTFRWLGFIQGCLWTSGLYSLEEIKNHNKTTNNT